MYGLDPELPSFVYRLIWERGQAETFLIGDRILMAVSLF